MNETVLCSILSAAAVLCSALIAYFTARHTAKRELEKQSAQWKREDAVRYTGELKEFSRALEAYLGRAQVPAYRNELQDATAHLIAVTNKADSYIVSFREALNRGDRDSVRLLGDQIRLALRLDP